MDEEIEIINTNTRIEKIKNFFVSKRKQIITLFIILILILNFLNLNKEINNKTRKLTIF